MYSYSEKRFRVESFAKKIQEPECNHDAPEIRKLIELLSCKVECYLLMDRTYKDNHT